MPRDIPKKRRYFLHVGLATFVLDSLLVLMTASLANAVPTEVPKPRVPAPQPPAAVPVPVNRIPDPELASVQSSSTQSPSASSQNYDPLPVYEPSPSQPTVVETRPRSPIASGVVSCDEEGHIRAIRRIRYGEVVHCVLGDNSFRNSGRPMHIYQFQGKVNQPIVAKLIGGKPGDWQLSPYLIMLDPNREVIATDDNATRQRVAQVNVKLPETGIYTILASNGDAKQTGRYSVVVERDPNLYSVDRIEELDTRSSKLIQDNSPYNISEFQGEQDRLVTVRVSSSSFFPVIFLLDSDDRVLASNDNTIGARNAALEYRLPSSGTYKVLVNSLRPGDRGNYRLTVSSSSRLR
jgi:hypothetical protein